MTVNIYCDGGARGNPGPAAIGVAVAGKVRMGKFIGRATNNQAEYQAVIHALTWIKDNLRQLKRHPARIICHLDSTLVVNQLNGKFRIKNAQLHKLALAVRRLEKQIALPIIYQRIPRAKNRAADKLVNQALNRHAR